jgi:hypothetical protein
VGFVISKEIIQRRWYRDIYPVKILQCAMDACPEAEIPLIFCLEAVNILELIEQRALLVSANLAVTESPHLCLIPISSGHPTPFRVNPSE